MFGLGWSGFVGGVAVGGATGGGRLELGAGMGAMMIRAAYEPRLFT